jgi:hypothetical protein
VAVVLLWEQQRDRRKRLRGRTTTEWHDGTETKAGNAAQKTVRTYLKKSVKIVETLTLKYSNII